MTKCKICGDEFQIYGNIEERVCDWCAGVVQSKEIEEQL